ncbi:MAG: DUF5362 family protein [Bacteroidia bacterium]
MAIQDFENREIVLSPQAGVLLDETRKWAKFLAILGFIFCGLMILLGGVSSMFFDSFSPESAGVIPPILLFIFYAIMALIYFFPCLYLYRFAQRAKEAMISKNSEILTGSFDSLRDCFRYLGVVSIVVLALYAIGFIIVFVSIMFFSDMIPDAYTFIQ